MKKLIDKKTYPGNVIRAVFGDKTDVTMCYFDEVELIGVLDTIALSLTDEARPIFYSLYKEYLSEEKVAKKYRHTVQKVHDVHSLILRELRRPKNAKLLKKFTGSFRVVPIDGNSLFSQLPDDPIILTEHGDVKAVVLSIDEYDRLVSKE